ncbi:hypothetical protein Pr1d_49230 [Bythopirellula goksoeyrii]|uniref:Uncharacterized protein n=2 Tax=Bythopirellula goksoeyrii TaxID=1400387 RepID=A0A5B9QEW1_9BACT|nr:hypothetical protein Pr1d_49230 [Bythopirellula goksoeyrii]
MGDTESDSGGKLNLTADLTVATLSQQDGTVTYLLGGELTIDTILGVSAGGEFRALGGTLSDYNSDGLQLSGESAFEYAIKINSANS